jgi:hypothetical protein
MYIYMGVTLIYIGRGNGVRWVRVPEIYDNEDIYEHSRPICAILAFIRCPITDIFK